METIRRLTPEQPRDVAAIDVSELHLEDFRVLTQRARPLADALVALDVLLGAGPEIQRVMLGLTAERTALTAELETLRASVVTARDETAAARVALGAELDQARQSSEGEQDRLDGALMEVRRVHAEAVRKLADTRADLEHAQGAVAALKERLG